MKKKIISFTKSKMWKPVALLRAPPQFFMLAKMKTRNLFADFLG